MSYSISMRVRVHNTKCYLSLPITDANTTWNLKEMIQKSTGLDIRVFEDAITFKIALMVVKYMKYMETLDY